MKTKEKNLRILLIALLTAIFLMPSASFAQDQKPNILLIFMDNTGWGDLGSYGGGALRGAPTPHLDRLADEGMRLQNFNTEAQCLPSRAALLTGRHAKRSGNASHPIGADVYGLTPWEITIAEALSEQGYATAAHGKWHVGKTPGRFATDQGFDEWYGIPNSSDESMWISQENIRRRSIVADVNLTESEMPYIMESIGKGSKVKKVKRFDVEARRRLDGELTERTIDFMKRSVDAGKPFFIYAPLTLMHFPTIPHPDFAGKSGHGDYADTLVQSDHYVGQMLETIDRLGVKDNTIVIFTADNGIEHPDNGDGQWAGWTGPWSGTYYTAMEGGLRVPFIIRWPGKIPAGAVNNEIVHLVDLFPTLANFAGAEVPNDRAIDGIDMSEFFLGKSTKSGRESFVIYVGEDLAAVKWRNWKIHFMQIDSKYSTVRKFSTVPWVVNLIQDPGETRQVAEPDNGWIQYPFTKVLKDWMGSVEKYPHVPLGAPDDYRPPK